MTSEEFAALIAAEPVPRWSNCLFWAMRMMHRHGGYCVLRRGHNGVPFHALWSPDHINVASYEPLVTQWKIRHWRGDLLLLFRGAVVIGDAP